MENVNSRQHFYVSSPEFSTVLKFNSRNNGQRDELNDGVNAIKVEAARRDSTFKVAFWQPSPSLLETQGLLSVDLFVSIHTTPVNSFGPWYYI